jgi:hypothetical protein
MGAAHAKTIAAVLSLVGFAAVGATTLTIGRSPTAPTVRAQNDSIRAAADTLIREACRGGTLSASMLTCSGSNQAPRKEWVRRLAFRTRVLANRSDSLFVKPETVTVTVHTVDTVKTEAFYFGPPRPAGACMPPECPYSQVQIITNSDSMWYPPAGTDTVTLCAVIQQSAPTGNLGVKQIAWPPVRIRFRAETGELIPNDSVLFGRRGGNPLAVMCKKAMDHFGITTADSATAPAVSWSGIWFPYRGRLLWRPIASHPIP